MPITSIFSCWGGKNSQSVDNDFKKNTVGSKHIKNLQGDSYDSRKILQRRSSSNGSPLRINKNITNHSYVSNNLRRRRCSSSTSSSNNGLKNNKNVENNVNGTSTIRWRRSSSSISSSDNSAKIIKNKKNYLYASTHMRQCGSSSDVSSSENNFEMNKNVEDHPHNSYNMYRRQGPSNLSQFYAYHQINRSPFKLRQYGVSFAEDCAAKATHACTIISQQAKVIQKFQEENDSYYSCEEDN